VDFSNGGAHKQPTSQQWYRKDRMDTILKLAVVGVICGGGAIAIAVVLQLIAQRASRKEQ